MKQGCPGVPILVVCCKSDIPGSKHKDSVAAFFGYSTEQEKLIRFVSASATTADDKQVREETSFCRESETKTCNAYFFLNYRELWMDLLGLKRSFWLIRDVFL